MFIKRMGLVILTLLASMPLLADNGIDQRIDEAIKPFADSVAGFIFSSSSAGRRADSLCPGLAD